MTLHFYYRLCNKKFVDCKNSTGKVNHLLRCPEFAKTNYQLTNKVRGLSIKRPLFQVQFNSQVSNEMESTSPLKTAPVNQDSPIKTFLLSDNPYPKNSVEKNKLEGLLLDVIVNMNLPISIVDHPAFIKYSSKLNNRFRIPCRQTYTKKIIPEKVKIINNNLFYKLHTF